MEERIICKGFSFVSGSSACLNKPHKAQYGGGIITNPELDNGLNGWSRFGYAKIQHRESRGNKFVVAHGRNQNYDSVSQKLYLRKNNVYTFSAWIQVRKGNHVPVTATFKTGHNRFKQAGFVVAKSHCWSFLKGGLTVDASGPAELYFESNNTSVDIWVDSISLQPFTQKQWRSHQYQTIEKVRKTNVRIRVVDIRGNPLSNATISIEQKNPSFPFGCAINKNILTNTGYQNWFTSRRFTVTTFEDEMKWYSTEATQGHEDYSVADDMLRFAKGHKLSVRGHNVFWDDPQYQPWWVKSLSAHDLSSAAAKRLNSAVGRYKGQLIAWDVVNENLHHKFFESQLSNSNASAMFYNWAFGADSSTTMFLNEYNTIESPGDWLATPAQYLNMLKEIQSFPGNAGGKLGIGLESHFSSPNLAYVRSSLDILAATGLPIWITELDVQKSPNQAKYLEEILREVYSHPGIKGIVIWAAWKPQGCWQMCLTDNNFKNLPTGDVVDRLMAEWGLRNDVVIGKSNAYGFYGTSLLHGDYQVRIAHPQLKNSSMSTWSLSVAPLALATRKRSTSLLIQIPA
ncbi:Glycoside hydrolase [Trema orientale]|uniref:Glycoside hydrolase n=1 Tax=Trema orientale TaxID=63057 RepID=A0A2P5EYC4_TREOI|nr:Glycoside hydrolase [Trema orientale]